MISEFLAGTTGVIKDVDPELLSPETWSDASNMRFLDGMASQIFGYNQPYGTPTNTPQYLLPLDIGGTKYWIYPTASNIYCVSFVGGERVETDLSHLTARTGIVNNWTGCVLAGIPILTAGDNGQVPMYWDTNLANNFVDLTNWPALTYCRAIRAYKNFLIALRITKTSTEYPYMVKWSDPAVPGSLPSSWDHTDATKNAGEIDISEGDDIVIDGMQLGDSFMVYKERSVWRMDLVGGQDIFRLTKVDNRVGVLNRNCISVINGAHVVLGADDVYVTDGYTTRSLISKTVRRYLFQEMDGDNYNKAFCVANPYFNEIMVCYPSAGNTVCNKALVVNYEDNTASFRTLPNINHAALGATDSSQLFTWDNDTDPWDADITLWDNPNLSPSASRVLMASSDTKIFLIDSQLTFDGATATSSIERAGLDFGDNTAIKLIKAIRPIIKGTDGKVILISVGYQDHPEDAVTWVTTQLYIIGETIQCDFLVSGRYIAIKFENGGDEYGGPYYWRLDKFKVEYELTSVW